MTLRLRLCILLILVLDTAPVLASPKIAIYTDAFGTRCTDTTINGVLKGSVWAEDMAGITGAEFSVCCDKYWTHNLILTFTSPPGSIQLNDPLGCKFWDRWATGGVSLAFTECQASPRVRLFTFLLFEKAPTQDITLHLTAKQPPANPYFGCPLITLCDAPAYTKQCVALGQDAIINPGREVRCSSSFSDQGRSPQLTKVNSSSWSAVKNVYR